ncbi:MAG: hypothetical protein Q8M02_09660 [Candidatus Didemnitutus sp.]|nr:hypothetical protein [Candidatus Didemnitutus sp.]
MVRFLRYGVALTALIAATLATASTASPFKPGQTYFDADRHVEYQAGSLPIIFTAPHGGKLTPRTIPDRTSGVTMSDAFTQELARAVNAEFQRRAKQPPHVIISLLHRKKLDPNREIKEAAQGSPVAERAWVQFHESIKESIRVSLLTHGFAFIIDLHGHGHAIPRLELGYGIDGAFFNQTDAELDAAIRDTRSTLNELARRSDSFAKIIRGPRSLGGLFETAGFRAVPGTRDPGPGNFPYFNGGYIVRTYAGKGRGVDGLQIEAPRAGVRETEETRAKFATALFDSLAAFLAEHYSFDLITGKRIAQTSTAETSTVPAPAAR